jgi:ABC-type phosphate/phosphonate transport system substrate-binding protein
MAGPSVTSPTCCQRGILVGAFLATFAALIGGSVSAHNKVETLRVGTSGSLFSDKAKNKDKAALESLQSFIKTETGLNNEILKAGNWEQLAKEMTDGKVELGVFQGYEYAWVQAKDPTIKPLALAVNGDRYPSVYIVAKKDSPIKDFAGLGGQTLALANNSPGDVRFYIEREALAAGKPSSAFFSKITSPDDPLDALDEVVDGGAQATAVERTALEVYKKQKPGRFKQLKEVAHSAPLPPVVITYQEKALDAAMLLKFRMGLMNANKTDRGQTMLNSFGLTAFEAVPADFDKVLASTRKTYPPETGAK